MNPFAALESDDEDESFTKVQSNKKTDSKKPTQAKNQSGSSAAAPAVTVNNTDKKVAGRGGGGRGDNRSRGRGAGRGGKETGDRIKNNKREYDRRSGTGRGTEVTKGGAGKGGWGTNEEEIAVQRRELEEGGDTTVEKTTETEIEEEPVEPEAPTYTMDEFLAKRNAERSGSSIFKKVEERQVTDDFSNLNKKTGDLSSFIALGAGKTKGGSNGQGQRSSDKNKVTNLGFHAAPKADFREERGGRGDRGGKGGGKGSGGRGGGERRNAPRAGGKVDINDQSAFPSL